MRKRNIQILIRLNENENKILLKSIEDTGMTKGKYIRSLICGNVPKQKPSVDFFDTINQLRRIGNNLNQLVMIAHKTRSIDIVRYKKDIAELNKNILEIREKVLITEEKHNGDD